MEKISKKITYYLEKKEIIIKNKEVYQYGFEAIISSMLGTFILIIVGIILHNLFNALIYELLFTLLRRHTGGYHCKTHLSCILLYNFMFILIIFVKKYINVSFFTIIITLLWVNLILWTFAPVQNINKQVTYSIYLKNKKQTKLYSFVVSVMVLIFYILNLNNYKVIFFTLIIITLLVLVGRKENERFIF